MTQLSETTCLNGIEIKGRALVMAKIEKPQAIHRLEEVIEVSDALMVARGDLGVEMPLEKVPGLQKRITRMARRYGKPVVVATQMLESMISSPVPTRAEVSDVATAVFEGADAVMLSAESAAGKYPVEAVSTMNRIAEEVEKDAIFRPVINAQRATPEQTGADAIAAAARELGLKVLLDGARLWNTHVATGTPLAAFGFTEVTGGSLSESDAVVVGIETPRGERDALVRASLERVGLQHRLDHRPSQLSGGGQQRVALRTGNGERL